MTLRGRWRRHPEGELRLDGYRTVAGNSVSLLVDGEQAFPEMLAAIDAATRSIVLESYIYANDATGVRFREALISRARQGVHVRVLIDGVGSLTTPASFFAPLREAGGEIWVYGPPAPWRPAWGFWRRDHRKILVVDDEVAFVGGLNIADEYAPAAWGGGAWHDIHVRLAGPAARELTKIVNRTWKTLSGQDMNPYLGSAVVKGQVPVQVLESRLTQRHSIRVAYVTAIRRARSSIRITNAYFVPDQGVRRALCNASQRGVSVELLLAGKSDMRLVQQASRAIYAALLGSGVAIYEWTERVLHAKSAVIDDCWCSVGSYNMDHRSLLHNLEANVVCLDRQLGSQLDEVFRKDISHSIHIDPAQWHRRPLAEKLLEQLCYKLRVFL